MANSGPVNDWRRTRSVAVGTMFGVALGAILANTVPDQSAGTVFCGFLAIVLSGVAVHEFGHAIAAILVRFELISISVGPLVLQTGRGGLRVRLSGICLGGLTMALPKGTANLRSRFMAMVVAGPLTSVLAGLTGVVLGHRFQFSWWGGWTAAWGYCSVLLGLLSLIPMRRFYYSDGARLALLMRNTPAAERNCAMLAMGAAASAGIRPRDWQPGLVGAACAACDDGSGDGIRAAIFGYENAMDTGRFEEAGKYLDVALAKIDSYPPMAKAGIALDAAFFEAMVRADAAAARQWLDKSNTRLVRDRYAVLLVQAAVYLAEGNISEAKHAANASRAILTRATLPGFACAAEEWLDKIDARCVRAVATGTEH